MKKLVIILLMVLGLGTANAQTKGQAFVQAGVSAGVDKVAHENLEIGIVGGKNRISAVGESYDGYRIDRQYLLGAKYARSLFIMPDFNALLSLAAKTNTRNVGAYVIEPGVGVEFSFGGGLSVITGVSTPITQSSFSARKAIFSGNAGLKLNL